MFASVAVQNPAVKPEITLTLENAEAVGEAYRMGKADGRKGNDADAIFFAGELGTAYRLGYEVGVIEVQIEADAALVERAEIEAEVRSEYGIWF